MNRKTYCIAVLLAALTAHISSSAEAIESVVKRTTLLVSDLEQSVEFYKAIGFSEWHGGEGNRDPNSEAGLPLNGKPAKYNFTIVSGKHPSWAMIGLLEFSNPPLPWTRDSDDPAVGTSDAVLVVGTDDIEQVHKNLRRLGTRILQEPKEWESTSGAGREHGYMMMFLDPDGRVIEMMQVDGIEPYQ